MEKGIIEVIEELLEADMTTEAKGQDKTVQKNVNDKETPDAEKETLSKSGGDNRSEKAEADKEVNVGKGPEVDQGGSKGDNPSDASAKIDADKGPHDQASDAMETPTKANPKGVAEEKDEDEEGDKEELSNKQKDVDVDDDGDIDAKDLKNLRKGVTDKDVGKDDGEERGEEEDDTDDDGDVDADDKKAVKESQDVDKDKNSNGIDDEDEGEDREDPAVVKEADDEEMKDDEESDESKEDDKEEVKEASDEEMKDDEESDESKEDDKEEVKEASDQDKKVEKKANDKQLPDDEKETLDKDHKGDVSGEAEADKKDHDQGGDPVDTPTKANPKGVAEEAEAEAEEVEEDVLDEDFKAKAAVVFETAVNEKVNTIREEVEAEYASKLEEEVASMNEKFSEYVDFAVQEWLKENTLEIKYSLRTEIAENFITGLKDLFEENYIDIPEDDVSVVDELTEAVESYKDQLSESEEEIEELKSKVLFFEKSSVVEKVAEGLTQTQTIRLEKLSESVEATDIEEFEEKLDALKESYFNESDDSPLPDYLGEEVIGTEQNLVEEETTSSVSAYAQFLSKTIQK